MDKGEFIAPIGIFHGHSQCRRVSLGAAREGPGQDPVQIPLVQLCRALLSARVSFQVLELSKELELPSCREAMGKANMPTAWHIGLRENKDQGYRAVLQDHP